MRPGSVYALWIVAEHGRFSPGGTICAHLKQLLHVGDHVVVTAEQRAVGIGRSAPTCWAAARCIGAAEAALAKGAVIAAQLLPVSPDEVTFSVGRLVVGVDPLRGIGLIAMASAARDDGGASDGGSTGLDTECLETAPFHHDSGQNRSGRHMTTGHVLFHSRKRQDLPDGPPIPPHMTVPIVLRPSERN